MIPCPACIKGSLNDDGRCTKCGVYVHSEQRRLPISHAGKRRPRLRPDQDRVRPMTDYIRTQQDKS